MTVENLARVRFVMAETGPTPVFQGFHRGEHGMAGAIVYVTADTLRAMVDWHNAQATPFDAIHNRMENEEAILAFGGSTPDATIILAPDGFTPLYMVTTYEPIIVQRFDPNGGRTHKVYEGGVLVGTKPYGVWVNVAPYEGETTPVGFVVDPQGWAEGRTDTPPIGEAESEQALVDAAEALTGKCWLWQNGWATTGDDYRLAGYMDGGAEQAAECRTLRRDAECVYHQPYFDHDGNRTEDPRCELGLCVECIDASLSSGEVPIVPALSTHDPRYLTDAGYRERVRKAYEVAGVTYREPATVG